MSEDTVRCSCCGKLVPAINVELSFRRPDEIAALDEGERAARCKFNSDIFVLDEERYFIRCTIPLPVHESGEPYSIGAWAEIDAESFQRIWDLWDDENQASQPPLNGVLANSVPLMQKSLGCSVQIQLVGPTTRPHLLVSDQGCSLYQEQRNGISFHRASEYSDLVRA